MATKRPLIIVDLLDPNLKKHINKKRREEGMDMSAYVRYALKEFTAFGQPEKESRDKKFDD